MREEREEEKRAGKKDDGKENAENKSASYIPFSHFSFLSFCLFHFSVPLIFYEKFFPVTMEPGTNSRRRASIHGPSGTDPPPLRYDRIIPAEEPVMLRRIFSPFLLLLVLGHRSRPPWIW